MEFFTTELDHLFPSPSDANIDSAWEGESFQQQTDKDPSAEPATDDTSASEKAGAAVVNYLSGLMSTATLAVPTTSTEDIAKQRQETIAKVNAIQWTDLFHSKGMPADPTPSFDNSLTDAAEALANAWISLEGKTPKGSSQSKADIEVRGQQPAFLKYDL